jgi:hypothetical protein
MREVWKDIPGYESFYQVSNLGRVKSLPRFRKGRSGKPVAVRERIKAQITDARGYKLVNLFKNAVHEQYQVHQLVAMSFIPNPLNKKETNHKDGCKTNNNLTNLEWVTRKENAQHAARMGLIKGNRKGKFTPNDIQIIRGRLQQGDSQSQIARDYKVDQSTISDIHTGQSWWHVV